MTNIKRFVINEQMLNLFIKRGQMEMLLIKNLYQSKIDIILSSKAEESCEREKALRAAKIKCKILVGKLRDESFLRAKRKIEAKRQKEIAEEEFKLGLEEMQINKDMVINRVAQEYHSLCGQLAASEERHANEVAQLKDEYVSRIHHHRKQMQEYINKDSDEEYVTSLVIGMVPIFASDSHDSDSESITPEPMHRSKASQLFSIAKPMTEYEETLNRYEVEIEELRQSIHEMIAKNESLESDYHKLKEKYKRAKRREFDFLTKEKEFNHLLSGYQELRENNAQLSMKYWQLQCDYDKLKLRSSNVNSSTIYYGDHITHVHSCNHTPSYAYASSSESEENENAAADLDFENSIAFQYSAKTKEELIQDILQLRNKLSEMTDTKFSILRSTKEEIDRLTNKVKMQEIDHQRAQSMVT